MSSDIVPHQGGEIVGDVIIDWEALLDGLPDLYAEMLPFLVFGMPYSRIAKIFDIDKSTITKALLRDRGFARAVARGRQLVKAQLHQVWLNQRAVQAWRSVDEILDTDPFARDDDGKYIYTAGERRTILQEKGKMVRFVLSQLGLHVQRVEVLNYTPEPMFRGDESLAKLIAQKIEEYEPVDQLFGMSKHDSEVSLSDLSEDEIAIDPRYNPQHALYRKTVIDDGGE